MRHLLSPHLPYHRHASSDPLIFSGMPIFAISKVCVALAGPLASGRGHGMAAVDTTPAIPVPSHVCMPVGMEPLPLVRVLNVRSDLPASATAKFI